MRGTLKSGTSVCVCSAGHRTLLHPRGGGGALCKVWVRMGGVFGSHFRGRRAAWCERVKVSFCKTEVTFDFGHNDDFAQQAQYFGCLGLIFRANLFFF